ncbi:phage tail length tape measure family protein [Massilia oculi]|uniref:Phage tail length tape measure family protein n=1 Tax=Massilia hydrophila TaxID=3044279 RepID=A0ABS7YEG9_9BURK|nr:phage tail length tape measure family protein [Massilia oculi]MCA1857457.1 phage tail length tape measure family protein [Massilia oculi]
MSDTTSTAEIRIVADASGVEAGLQQATTAANRAERTLTTGANNSARSQQNLVQAIQRTTAQMESGGRTGARYYEILARQRGVDPAALEPYLRQLRAVEQAQQRAGQSAAQTTNAMRQLPAQLTDVLTSLQGGSSPLTVLMQQGGQVVDSFGGVGSAIRNVGARVLGLLNPITLATAAVAGLGYAYYAGSKEARAYNLAIAQTGNAAGTSAALMAEAAAQTADFIGSQSNAAEVLASMVATGQISGAAMVDLSVTAIKAQRDLGREVGTTVEEFASLGKDPVKALADLASKYHHVTAATYAQVKALQDEGRTVEAVTLAQKAHAEGIEGQTQRVVENLGYIEAAWRGIKNGVTEAAGSVKDWFLSIGREDTLADLTASAAKIQQNINDANARKDTWGARKQQVLLDAVNAEIAAMQKKLDLSQKQAEADARSARAEQLRIEITNGMDKLLSREELRTRALAAARVKAAENGLNEVETKNLLAITAKEYADVEEAAQKKREAAAKAAAEQLKKEAALLAELAGLTPDFAENWDRLGKAYAKGALSLEQLTKAQADLLAKQPGIKKANDDQLKAQAESDKLYEQGIRTATQYRDSLLEQLTAQRQNNEVIGLSVDAVADLQAQRLLDSAALKEETAAALDFKEPGSQVAQLYREQAAALRDLADAKREGARKQIAVDSAKKAAEEWKRAADSIEQSLTDALLRGFESGKSFGKNLIDTLKNMFSTLVLRPVIQAAVQPMSSQITALMQGGGSAGNGVGGLGSLASLFGNTSIGKGATSALGGAATYGGWVAVGMAIADGLYKNGFTDPSTIQKKDMLHPLVGESLLFNKVFQALGMSSKTANLLSGASIATALFGRKNPEVKSSDLWGNLTSSTGFQGAQRDHWEAKGGVFRSDKEGTAYTPVTTEVYEFLSDTYADLRATTKAFAEALGADASSIATRTDAINVAIGKTEEETQKNLAAYFEGLADTMAKDLVPSLVHFQQKGESAAATLQRLATDYAAVDAVLQSIGMTMGAVGLSSLGARERLIEAAGGVEAFAANAQGFAQNFLTEAERLAPVQKYVTEQLAAMGLASVDTRDEFKSVVLGLDLTTEAGAKQYGALMQLQAAFAQVYPVIEAVAESAGNAAAKLAEVNKGYQDQIDEILRGRMSPDDRRAAEIQGMDASTVALYDRLAALRAEVAALDETAARAQAVADERIELQDQLDALTLSSVELLDKQRAALDASNRSLFDQVQAATRAQAVLEERKSVQEQLDSLTLTSTQLLEKQRNALDESNRALFDQVQIAQKAAAVLAERTSLQGRLDELTLSPAQLLEKQRAAVNESNRALFDQVNAAEALTGARTALTSAYQAESDAIKATTDRMVNFAKTLRGLRDSTLLGNLSPLTPMQKYQEARAQYERTVAAARGGDEAAQGRYADAYRAFLEASQLVNASGAQYQADFAFAQAATEEAAKWAEMQVDVGQASLEALKAQVAGLLDVQGAVLTVRDAVNNLSALLIAAGQPVPTGGQGNAIESIYKSMLGRQADPAGMEFWTKQLQAGISIRDITEAFKRSDEYLMQQAPIRAQDYGTGASTALVAEIKSLREENGSMRAELKGLRDDLRKQTGDQIQAEADISDRSTNKLTAALTDVVRAVGQREPSRVAPV